MITVANLAKNYGSKILFEQASLNLYLEHRYGLVGANGSGKTTFLRIVSGEEEPSAGTVSIAKKGRVGVLRQDQFLADDEVILDIVMAGHRELHAAFTEKEAMLAGEGDFDHERFHDLEEFILANNGYALESQAGEILAGLGIPAEVHRNRLGTLSGGFKLRVLLAQVLAGQPDLLLLDEPTNHLDILAIRWLERFLCAFPGMALVISHDHRFLDNVCTDIIDVDYERLTTYPGNYSEFALAKLELREQKEAEIAKQEKKIADAKRFADRFKAKATKARQAASKLKLADRIKVERLPPSSRRYPTFRFTQVRPSGKDVLTLKGVSKSFGEKQVLKDVSLIVRRGERVALIGPNGAGKSTLIKACVGELAADAGTVTWGHEAHVGYFAQDQKAIHTNRDETVQGWLWNWCAGESFGFVRNQLGLVLFSGEEAEKKVAALSGGETARLTFAKLAVTHPNVLVLDEPTNHLDLEAIEALVDGLAEYDGTLLFVSHDRWFVSNLATRVVEVTPQGFRDFQGSYEEYLEKLGDDHLDEAVIMDHGTKAPKKDDPPKGKRK